MSIVELRAGMDAGANGSGSGMKHEVILEGQEWLPRQARVDLDFDVQVHCTAGSVDAQILNISADGFRIHSASPIHVGAEVILEVASELPVKALICWACGLEAGGVFAESVAL